MTTMRVADYLVDRMVSECAEHIFTVTGRGILYLTDAVAKNKSAQAICVHHEQAAAFAAVSYASYTGRPGVCLVSTGCAATNTLTGVLNAWQDQVPCLFVSGQNMLNETVRHTKIPVRTFGSQETDIIPLVAPLTKYSVMISAATQVAYELDKALYYANEGVKGPVWIDVPLDIQNARIEPEDLPRFTPQEDVSKQLPSAKELDNLVHELSCAERPVVLIGSGVRSASAEAALVALVERMKIPVTFAHSAVDVYGTKNDLSIGSVGPMYGTRAGNFAVQNCDLLLILGCRMTSMTTGSDAGKFARAAKIIAVDLNAAEFEKQTMRLDKLLPYDVKAVLEGLLANEQLPMVSRTWQEQCLHWKNTLEPYAINRNAGERIDLFHLAREISNAVPAQSVLLVDAGLEELILPTNVAFGAGMRCIHPTMQGSMGYALPAAVGAYFASGGLPVCAVVGDGSVMMNLQELQTIRHQGIPLKLIVVNNDMYAVIRKRQQDLFRTRTIGTDEANGVSAPSFEEVARCFGLDYLRIACNEELNEKLSILFSSHNAALCEIMALPNQEYLKEGHARTLEKKIARRPIEDQEPFLDRELFLSEMLIEPIDQ